MEKIKDLWERINYWWHDLAYSDIQKRALLIMGVGLLVLSSFVVFRGSSKEVIAAPLIPIEVSIPEVTVDVAGAVNNPGVYSLPAQSRVIDALRAAGNSVTGSDLSDLNLARVVKDGEQIYVNPTVRSANGKRIIKKIIPRGPININRATAREFDSLVGIGPVIAKRIVEYRRVNGPFMAIEDLEKVSGIGSAKFEELKSKISV
jgi:competence protein ComEA